MKFTIILICLLLISAPAFASEKEGTFPRVEDNLGPKNVVSNSIIFLSEKEGTFPIPLSEKEGTFP